MVFVIYVALMTTDLENIKINQSIKFPNLFSCTSYVQSNKNEIYDSAKEVYKTDGVALNSYCGLNFATSYDDNDGVTSTNTISSSNIIAPWRFGIVVLLL